MPGKALNLCWHAYDYGPRFDVLDHNSSCSYNCAFPDGYALSDHNSGADVGIGLDNYCTANIDACGDVDVVTDDAIVFHYRTRVDDNIFSLSRPRIDYCVAMMFAP